MAVKFERYIAETCSTGLHTPLRVQYVRIAPIEFNVQFLQYTALSTQQAIHVAVMREDCSHHYDSQSRAVLEKLSKYSTALQAPLRVKYLRIVPMQIFVKFLKYTALSAQPATHVAVMNEA